MKPKSLDIYLVYQCSCGAEHYIQLPEVQEIGKKMCFCGKVIILDYIQKIEANPIYSGGRATPPEVMVPILQKETKNPLFDDAISALVGLGYSKTAAKEKVQRVTGQAEYDNIQDLIRAIVSGG